MLQLASRAEGFINTGKAAQLMAIARQMGIALENRDLFEQTQRNLERIRALHEIDLSIARSLDLKTTLNVLLEKIEVFLPIPAAYTVKLFNAETGLMEPAACRNLDEADWQSSVHRRSRYHSHQVFKGEAQLIIGNVQTDTSNPEQPFFAKNRLHSYLGVPLMVKDGLLGVLGLYTHEEHDFTAEEIDFFATLAGQAAIAINNSQLHEETRKQTVELKKSNRVKDEFLGVMSHELRTPLSVIRGYANLLDEEAFGANTAEQAKGIRIIRDRTDGLLAMVRNILEAAQLESGAVTVEAEVVDILNFLPDLKQTYSHLRPGAPALIWNIGSTLPTVVTDGGKLKKILHNLVDNAVKFTENGSVTVSVRVAEKCAARFVKPISSVPTSVNDDIRNTRNAIPTMSYLELTVNDTGVGIAPDAMPRLFDKFAQADSTDNRGYEGIGLGLFIVKKLTALLGGEVHVESEPGRGSTFTVTVPCVPYGAGARKGLNPSDVSALLQTPILRS